MVFKMQALCCDDCGLVVFDNLFLLVVELITIHCASSCLYFLANSPLFQRDRPYWMPNSSSLSVVADIDASVIGLKLHFLKILPHLFKRREQLSMGGTFYCSVLYDKIYYRHGLYEFLWISLSYGLWILQLHISALACWSSEVNTKAHYGTVTSNSCISVYVILSTHNP